MGELLSGCPDRAPRTTPRSRRGDGGGRRTAPARRGRPPRARRRPARRPAARRAHAREGRISRGVSRSARHTPIDADIRALEQREHAAPRRPPRPARESRSHPSARNRRCARSRAAPCPARRSAPRRTPAARTATFATRCARIQRERPRRRAEVDRAIRRLARAEARRRHARLRRRARDGKALARAARAVEKQMLHAGILSAARRFSGKRRAPNQYIARKAQTHHNIYTLLIDSLQYIGRSPASSFVTLWMTIQRQSARMRPAAATTDIGERFKGEVIDYGRSGIRTGGVQAQEAEKNAAASCAACARSCAIWRSCPRRRCWSSAVSIAVGADRRDPAGGAAAARRAPAGGRAGVALVLAERGAADVHARAHRAADRLAPTRSRAWARKERAAGICNWTTWPTSWRISRPGSSSWAIWRRPWSTAWSR